MNARADHVYDVELEGPDGPCSHAVFYWKGEIDWTTVHAVAAYAESKVREAESRDEKGFDHEFIDAIFVWDTKGGSAEAMTVVLSLYRVLRRCSVRVWTVADVEALSAGSHLVLRGDAQRRYAMPFAEIGTHSARIKDADEIRAEIIRYYREEMEDRASSKELDGRRSRLLDALSEHVGTARAIQRITRDELETDTWQIDSYMSASSALSADAARTMVIGRAMKLHDHGWLVEHGLLDAKEPPEWLQQVVKAARDEAVKRHGQTDHRR